MRYLISERQYKTLTEIEKTSGHYITQPVYDVLEFFDENLENKEKVSAFRKYFEGKLGFEPQSGKKFPKVSIISFFQNLSSGYWPDLLQEKSSLSGFAYYIAKNYFNLEQGVDLLYLVKKDGDEREFYFFDPLFKIFVGKFTIQKKDYFPKKTFKVSMSATDEELIGTGYGTKMYLSVINTVDYLYSDFTLFSGSYRMWKYVLPKYVNVWGVIEKELGNKYEKIDPTKKKSVKKYDFFVASNKETI